MIFKREGTGPSPQIQAKKYLHTFLPFLFFFRERVTCQKADNKRSVWKFSAFILDIISKRNGKAAFFLSAQKQIQKIITFYPFGDIAIGFN